jgi:hypothetical protein
MPLSSHMDLGNGHYSIKTWKVMPTFMTCWVDWGWCFQHHQEIILYAYFRKSVPADFRVSAPPLKTFRNYIFLKILLYKDIWIFVYADIQISMLTDLQISAPPLKILKNNIYLEIHFHKGIWIFVLTDTRISVSAYIQKSLSFWRFLWYILLQILTIAILHI